MLTQNRTIAALLKEGAEQLSSSEVDQPYHEARLLLSHVLEEPLTHLIAFPEKRVAPHICEHFQGLLMRRLRGEPLAKIFQRKAFWKSDFITTQDTLDPRPETEHIIEAVLAAYPQKDMPHHILELGVGTGCLLLSLLQEYPLATGIGVDLSPHALAIAQVNGEQLHLSHRTHWIQGHWAASLKGGFSLIVSNPPYIPTGQLPHLAATVRDFDPLVALDGGADGLDAYRNLARQIQVQNLLLPDGFLGLEVGAGQSQEVRSIVEAQGFTFYECHKDLAGIERTLVFRSIHKTSKKHIPFGFQKAW